MLKNHQIAIFLLSAMLTACMADEGDTGSQEVGDKGSSANLDLEQDDFIEVPISVLASDIALERDSKIKFTMYGFDETIADMEASVIKEMSFEIDELPKTFIFKVPTNPHTLIDQGIGPVELQNAEFYWSLRTDIDGDGQSCRSVDAFRDWEATPFTPYAEGELQGLEFDVQLVGLEGDFCEEFDR